MCEVGASQFCNTYAAAASLYSDSVPCPLEVVLQLQFRSPFRCCCLGLFHPPILSPFAITGRRKRKFGFIVIKFVTSVPSTST